MRNGFLLLFFIYLVCDSSFSIAQSGHTIEETFTFSHPSGVGESKGSIFLPALQGTFSCVIIVQDINSRSKADLTDQSIIELIQGFLEKNIAVIQYQEVIDSNTTDQPSKTIIAATEELSQIYRAAVSHPFIKPESVGLLGFGEGALVAAKLAATHAEIGFLCLINVPALPKSKAMLLDAYDTLHQRIVEPKIIQKYIDLLHIFIEISKREQNESQWKEQIIHTIENHLGWFTAEEKKTLQIDKKTLFNAAKQLSNNQMQYAYTYDPLEDLSMLEQPVLALYLDNNKSSQLNADALKEMTFILDRSQFTIVTPDYLKNGRVSAVNPMKIVEDWLVAILP